jgi:anti-sigma regulatory factor (Ser/Thr protein kinase)
LGVHFEHYSVDSMSGESPVGQGLTHLGFLYHGVSEYVDTIADFVREGLTAGEPAMVAVPGRKVDLLQASLKVDGAHYVDMTELGRNPGRIIPAIHEFVGQFDGGPTRFVGEPIWLGRNSDETAEAIRHEALINLAFAGSPVTVLCPYDGDVLPRDVIDASWRIHPVVIDGGLARISGRYGDPEAVYADDTWPLAPSPPGAKVREFRTDLDLTRMRSWVQHFGWSANLTMDRVDDLVLAVSEVAGNSVRHGGGAGSLALWCDDRGAVVCEVRDLGHIDDPLVGRHPPGPDLEVKGLWLVNQLCDLVQIRSGPDGTCVRLTISG